uniref:Quorum sensing LuxR family sensor regulator n=1 Tax=Burkholderia glumae TaxID=337 RepID=A1KWS2_BURGL|nr:quorum sensing LuxR family sensor regulator [Burkholderia glumae LMG 2196 = ATCC 33617]
MELRWQDAYHQFNTAENEQQLFHQVSAYSKRLGFEYCCYGIRVPQPGSQPLVEIFDTYPPGWMAHYQARNYIEIDPTVRDGAASPNMIIWPDADAAEQPSLWRDARDFGMSVGVAQSSWAARGVFGLLTIARRSDRLTPAEINSLTLQANWLANLSHSLMGRFLVPKLSPAASISLTKREREVLSWTSEGRTASEIGEQLNISERTVTFHINNILAKLGAANKVQAVGRQGDRHGADPGAVGGPVRSGSTKRRRRAGAGFTARPARFSWARHSISGSASLAVQLTLEMLFSMLMRLAICSSFCWSFGCSFSVAVTLMRSGGASLSTSSLVRLWNDSGFAYIEFDSSVRT